MVKKSLIFILILLTLFSSIVLASEPRLQDEARLVTGDSINEVKGILQRIKEKYDVPVIVYTTNEEINNSRSRADSLLADYVGVDKDGLLLCINMNTGDYYISFSGRVLSMIDDDRLAKLDNNLLQNLKSGNYNKAIINFLADSETYIAGGEIAGNKLVDEKQISSKDVLISGSSGLLTFILSYFGLKKGSTPSPSGLIFNLYDNTKANLLAETDQLINTNTVSRILPKIVQDNGRGSGSGGSVTTTHRGPGGGTFGGGGGKFK